VALNEFARGEHRLPCGDGVGGVIGIGEQELAWTLVAVFVVIA